MNLTGFIPVAPVQVPQTQINQQKQQNIISTETPQQKQDTVTTTAAATAAAPVEQPATAPQKTLRAKNGFFRSIAGLLGGGLTDMIVTSSLIKPLNISAIKSSAAMSEQEKGYLSQAADYAINESKAALKGANILRVGENNPENYKKAARMFKAMMDKSIMKIFPEEMRYLINCSASLGVIETVKAGTGSVLMLPNNTIISPENAFHYSSIADLGKLINHNTTGGKILHYAQKGGKYLLPAVILLSICSREKHEENGKKLSGWEKFTNAVRHNAGKLAFLSMLPACILKIAGSNTGSKYVTEFLKNNSSDMLKKIAEAKTLNIASAVVVLASTTFATYLGVKIKDGLQHRKDKQLQNIVKNYS